MNARSAATANALAMNFTTGSASHKMPFNGYLSTRRGGSKNYRVP
jgi:hypothetical protein